MRVHAGARRVRVDLHEYLRDRFPSQPWTGTGYLRGRAAYAIFTTQTYFHANRRIVGHEESSIR